MRRRASDKAQDRTTSLVLILAMASSALAAIVGYQALTAINGFNAFVKAASEIRREKPMTPEGF